MSYILNALRKSEQERNPERMSTAQQLPMTSTEDAHRVGIGRIIVLLITFLIIVNLIFLGYLWHTENQSESLIPAQIKRTSPDQLSSISSEAPMVQKPGTNTAISDWVAAKEKIVPVTASKAAETKIPDPPEAQIKKSVDKPIVAKIDTKKQPTKRSLPSEDELYDSQIVLAEDQSRRVEVKTIPIPEARLESKTAVSGISLLRDLDPDFQSKVPVININVLAYDDAPNARFVIIDMVKYRIGQRIKETVQLKDILPDSVVLNFEGRDFRIDRP